ncbi:hypothetical protein NNRS527_00988 [Nitrosospira sp. NRS527]|nr:hypothetical protein NNRS527_00988 [Nitrosospira sp. NRS527]
MTGLLYQRIKFQELMYYLHYLPGFYPSVEPRHDEAGNSRTRHFQQKAGTLVSLYFNRATPRRVSLKKLQFRRNCFR